MHRAFLASRMCQLQEEEVRREMGLQTARHAPRRPLPPLGEGRCPVSFSAVLGGLSGPVGQSQGSLPRESRRCQVGGGHPSVPKIPPRSTLRASEPLVLCLPSGRARFPTRPRREPLTAARLVEGAPRDRLSPDSETVETPGATAGSTKCRLSPKWRKGAPGKATRGAQPRAVVTFRKENSLVPSGACLGPESRVNIY